MKKKTKQKRGEGEQNPVTSATERHSCSFCPFYFHEIVGVDSSQFDGCSKTSFFPPFFVVCALLQICIAMSPARAWIRRRSRRACLCLLLTFDRCKDWPQEWGEGGGFVDKVARGPPNGERAKIKTKIKRHWKSWQKKKKSNKKRKINGDCFASQSTIFVSKASYWERDRKCGTLGYFSLSLFFFLCFSAYEDF